MNCINSVKNCKYLVLVKKQEKFKNFKKWGKKVA